MHRCNLDLILYLGTVIDYRSDMKTKFVLLVIFLFTISLMSAQFNEYKYIIVPKKFDAYKQENKYQTSTTIKYLLTERGFNCVYDDALPEDLFKDRCLGLIVNLQDDSSFFSTKVSLVFKDCRSIEVFRTIEGTSKIKEFRPAYNQAINRAFVSLDGVDAAYQPKKSEEKEEGTLVLNFKNDVKKLPEDKDATSEMKKTEESMKESEMTKPSMDSAKKVVLEEESTQENQTYKSVKPKAALFDGGENGVSNDTSSVLYAQPIPEGYQLVDSTPKILYKLVRSSLENVFLVSDGATKGIVFQNEGKWYLESIENGVKSTKELNIKF